MPIWLRQSDAITMLLHRFYTASFRSEGSASLNVAITRRVKKYTVAQKTSHFYRPLLHVLITRIKS